MFSRKSKAPAPVSHDLSVSFGKLVEVRASGFGLIVAPIIIALLVMMFIGISVAPRAAIQWGLEFFIPQTAPAAPDRPPSA